MNPRNNEESKNDPCKESNLVSIVMTLLNPSYAGWVLHATLTCFAFLDFNLIVEMYYQKVTRGANIRTHSWLRQRLLNCSPKPTENKLNKMIKLNNAMKKRHEMIAGFCSWVSSFTFIALSSHFLFLINLLSLRSKKLKKLFSFFLISLFVRFQP